MFNILFQNVLVISLFTSFIIIILLLLSGTLAKRYTAKLKYYIWFVIALRLVIPFNFSFPNAPLKIETPTQNMQVIPNWSLNNRTDNLSASPAYTGHKNVEYSPLTRGKLSITEIISIIWIIGAMLVLIYHILGYLYFLRKAWIHKTLMYSPLYSRLVTDMRIRHAPALYQYTEVSSPLLAGFFHRVILLPVHEYTDSELEMILRHELVHHKRHDLWYKLLLVLTNALHWFNPVINKAVKQAVVDLELACDEEVLRDASVGDRQKYGETMLGILQRGQKRQTLLSTHFSSNKKTTIQRFTKILDTGKKSKGIVILFATILLIGVTGALVVWKNAGISDSLNATIYAQGVNGMVVSHDASHSYYLDETGKVFISYNNGKTTAEAPLTLGSSDLYGLGMEEYDTGFFLSEGVTAIAYGGDDTSIQVLISHDMGQTWNTYTVEGSKTMRTSKYIGFVTESEGWLVASPGSALGASNNYVFHTIDGGKTWVQTGNPNELYPRNITGAGFASKDIAFMSFRVDEFPGPTIYWTQDGGNTWEQLEVTVPEQYDYNIPLSPYFSGANGIYPIQYRSRENEEIITYYLTSKDYGKTWTYSASIYTQ